MSWCASGGTVREKIENLTYENLFLARNIFARMFIAFWILSQIFARAEFGKRKDNTDVI